MQLFLRDHPLAREKMANVMAADYVADTSLISWDKSLRLLPAPNLHIHTLDPAMKVKFLFIDFGISGELFDSLFY